MGWQVSVGRMKFAAQLLYKPSQLVLYVSNQRVLERRRVGRHGKQVNYMRCQSECNLRYAVRGLIRSPTGTVRGCFHQVTLYLIATEVLGLLEAHLRHRRIGLTVIVVRIPEQETIAAFAM